MRFAASALFAVFLIGGLAADCIELDLLKDDADALNHKFDDLMQKTARVDNQVHELERRLASKGSNNVR